MKNSEVIEKLNKVNRFMQREVENNKAFTNVQAKFKLRKNLKALQSVYALYEECLNEIIEKYNIESNNGIFEIKEDTPHAKEIQKDINDLMNAESNVDIEKISINDFSENCLLGDMELLDFMTIDDAKELC